MTYTIRFDESAEDDLKSLSEKLTERIYTKLEMLSQNPYGLKSKSITNTPFRRIRIGDYRVIYMVSNEEVIITIIKIGHRKNVYKNL